MTGRKLLEQLLDSYQSSYDIAKPFDINGEVYDAYASFNVTSAKYVLIKKAELWRADCFEHTFFRCVEHLNRNDLTYRAGIGSEGKEESRKKPHVYLHDWNLYL